MKRQMIIQRIKETIQRVAPDATTILYGSEARGDSTSDSDIDLLILLDRNQPRLSVSEEQDIIEPIGDIELETGITVSPTIILRNNWENRPFKTPFYVNVMNEGIVL